MGGLADISHDYAIVYIPSFDDGLFLASRSVPFYNIVLRRRLHLFRCLTSCELRTLLGGNQSIRMRNMYCRHRVVERACAGEDVRHNLCNRMSNESKIIIIIPFILRYLFSLCVCALPCLLPTSQLHISPVSPSLQPVGVWLIIGPTTCGVTSGTVIQWNTSLTADI